MYVRRRRGRNNVRPGRLVMGRLQSWLQGWPDKPRPHTAVALGNALSTARFHVAGWGIALGWAAAIAWMWKR